MTLVVRAPGKVNLCLFLGATRADGLHPLVSVVQPVSLADTLTLDPAPDSLNDEVVCPEVPGQNLAELAIVEFRARTGWEGPPVRLHIDKRVPVAAGMGGGSGDAAAALRLLSDASGLAIPAGVAAALGADVPAQLAPGRTFVTGAGEHVEEVPDPVPLGLVVVPSPRALSTRDVFREADRLGLARGEQELTEIAERVREYAHDLPDELRVNDLEPAAVSLCPSIAGALADLRAAGARAALVSGSGPTTYGIFDTDQEAEAVAAELLSRHPAVVACIPVKAPFGAIREG